MRMQNDLQFACEKKQNLNKEMTQTSLCLLDRASSW